MHKIIPANVGKKKASSVHLLLPVSRRTAAMDAAQGQWEMEKIKDWSTNEIKNHIWAAVECSQHIPGCVSIEALRAELIRRGEEPKGYHNT